MREALILAGIVISAAFMLQDQFTSGEKPSCVVVIDGKTKTTVHKLCEAPPLSRVTESRF
jgi:hypothetical protein